MESFLNNLIRLLPSLVLAAKSRAAFYADIQAGLMTPPVKLSARSVAWPEHEIRAINSARIAGQTNDQIRNLVSRLVEDRTREFSTASDTPGRNKGKKMVKVGQGKAA